VNDNFQVAAEARMVTAAVHLDRGDNAGALALYQQIADVRDDRTSWLFVAVLAVHSDDLSRGVEAFARVETLHDSGDDLHVPGDGRPPQLFNIAQAWLDYASALRDRGHFKVAMAPLESLRGLYEQLKITDGQYLVHRGVPPLETTMRVAMDVFRGLGAELDATAWLDEFGGRVDSSGGQYLRGLQDSLDADG
jgi:hypothetical protein